MVEQITGNQVREAAAAASIGRVEHHDCSLCGYMTAYLIQDGQLFFDPGCNCGPWSPPQPRTWESAADWINMQSNEAARQKIKLAFGFAAPPKEDASHAS